ncbi:MAG: biopolymer transporter ExbD [Proteobacteria bacterium]|nr:biopolymer transporter ExbD [Cystobacterineae bacterium]MCL2258983.1 biopolymer transporter ExbD [Cystobacterineae bacterium]MCL2314669.1 biopolymer transporter ExbD [Pseudomonadota bacterium]
MPIQIPGKRFGKRLAHSRVFGKSNMQTSRPSNVELFLTPLVDMFVIVVLFLMANFSATGEVLSMRPDIRLPEAANPLEMQNLDVPAVIISRTDIVFETKVVANTEDLEKAEELSVPLLKQELENQLKALEARMGVEAGEGFRDINLQADQDIPFSVIKRVMYTCAAAGYYNINFAVLSEDESKARAPEISL